MTPLATTTPRLEQEMRYDLVWQRRPDGSTIENYGNGKGFEFIPAEKVEVILGIPAYLVHDQAPAQNGFADWRMLVKYRLRSHNEESGSDIVTVFLDLSAPTGSSDASSYFAKLPIRASASAFPEELLAVLLLVNVTAPAYREREF